MKNGKNEKKWKIWKSGIKSSRARTNHFYLTMDEFVYFVLTEERGSFGEWHVKTIVVFFDGAKAKTFLEQTNEGARKKLFCHEIHPDNRPNPGDYVPVLKSVCLSCRGKIVVENDKDLRAVKCEHEKVYEITCLFENEQQKSEWHGKAVTGKPPM